MTVQEHIDLLTSAVNAGWIKGDDDLIVDWWTFDDLASQYDIETAEEARKLWKEVVARHAKYDDHDAESIRYLMEEVVEESR